MDIPLRLLIIEGEDKTVALELRALEAAGYRVTCTVAVTAAEMKAALAKEAFDMVITDHDLPQFDSTKAQAVMKQSGLDIPFIIVANALDDETAVALIKGGAYDYVKKEKMSNLISAVEHALKVAEDQRGLRQAEKMLQQSEERYHTLVEKAFEGIIVVQDGKVVFANPRAYEMIDYPRDQVDPKTFTDFLHEEDRQMVIDRHLRRLKGEQFEETYPVRLVDQKGNIKWALLSAARIDWDGKTATLTFLTDITVRKQAEDALRESEEKYRSLVTHSPDGIFIADLKGIFLAVNRSMCEILKYSEEELLSMGIWDIVPEQYRDLHEKRLADILTGKAPNLAAEYEVKGKDGDLHYVEILSAPYYKGKELIGFQGIARDITMRKQTEEKLLESFESLKKTLNDSINTMVKIVEIRDPYTAGHQHRVADLATAIAREMKLEDTRIDQLRTAAVIHDIGKMNVPSDILSKPGRLSDMELELIKTHAQGGYDIVKGMDFPGLVAKTVLQHHERLDGSGYPNQLKGEDTLLEAKILAVADVIEAMASHRPYRPALGIDKALEEVSKNKGKIYDPDVVDACLKLFNSGKFQFKSV